MESYTINLTTPVNELKELLISDLLYNNGTLIITLNQKDYVGLNIGEAIYYVRHIANGNNVETISRVGRILDKYSNKIVVSLPFNEMFSVKDIIKTYDNKTRIKLHKQHNIFQQDLDYCPSQTIYLYDENRNIISSIEASTNAFFIPLKYGDRKLTGGDCLLLKEKIDLCNNNDCDCGIVGVYDYIFIPDNASRDSILFSENISYDMLQQVKYVSFKYTPLLCETDGQYGFYKDNWLSNFIEEDSQCKIYNSGASKTCICVYDGYYKLDLGISSDSDELSLGNEDNFNTSFINMLAEELVPDTIDMERIKYVPAYKIDNNEKDGEIYYVWRSPYGTSKCDDEDTVYTKEDLTEVGRIDLSDDCKVYFFDNYGKLTNDYTNTNIENYYFDYEYINGLELPTLYKKFKNGSGCKYYLSETLDDTIRDITGITFYLHFREREKISDNDRLTKNTVYSSGNVYYDTWHIDPENSEFVWWNGYDVGTTLNKENFNTEQFTNFYNVSGKRSDLIGYLNFTDKDIFYRKKKVSKSFLRLSFYTSKNPVDQKLLYYSTIFLDDGELYGKYLKLLNNLTKNNVINKSTKQLYNENAFLVNYNSLDVKNRIDTKITVTNEYDKTKSSEGFNLYLFADDKNFTFENGEKTIYMRIDFNHAGNGKTIPMITWPKDENGNFCSLTTENYIDSLYIPVQLKYIKSEDSINGRYIYVFENSNIINDNLELILFEPKLDMISDNGEAPNDIGVIRAVPNNFIYNRRGENTFKIISNSKWSVETITSGLTISPPNGESGETEISIDNIPPESFNEIVFKTTKGNSVGYETVTILKSDNFRPYLKLSKEIVELSIISKETRQQDVEVICNTSWEISVLDETYKGFVQSGSSIITITIPDEYIVNGVNTFDIDVKTEIEEGFIDKQIVKTISVKVSDEIPEPNVITLEYTNRMINNFLPSDMFTLNVSGSDEDKNINIKLSGTTNTTNTYEFKLQYDSVVKFNTNFDGACTYKIKVIESLDEKPDIKEYDVKPRIIYDSNGQAQLVYEDIEIDSLKYDKNTSERNFSIQVNNFELKFGELKIRIECANNEYYKELSNLFVNIIYNDSVRGILSENVIKNGVSNYIEIILGDYFIQEIYQNSGSEDDINFKIRFNDGLVLGKDEILGANISTNVNDVILGAQDTEPCGPMIIVDGGPLSCVRETPVDLTDTSSCKFDDICLRLGCKIDCPLYESIIKDFDINITKETIEEVRQSSSSTKTITVYYGNN